MTHLAIFDDCLKFILAGILLVNTCINKAVVDIRPAVCNSTTDSAADTNPNLSPINAKLTLLLYIHATKSVVYLFLHPRLPLP